MESLKREPIEWCCAMLRLSDHHLIAIQALLVQVICHCCKISWVHDASQKVRGGAVSYIGWSNSADNFATRIWLPYELKRHESWVLDCLSMLWWHGNGQINKQVWAQTKHQAQPPTARSSTEWVNSDVAQWCQRTNSTQLLLLWGEDSA